MRLEADSSAAARLTSRRALLGGGTVALASVLAAGLPRLSRSAPSPAQDVQILQFALGLEELQAAFYTRAVEGGALSGELLEFAQVAGGHEREHANVLRNALGGQAQPAPQFTFGTATSDPDVFVTRAIELEDLGVAAYNGQAANLTRGALRVAARIVSVDARHAAWIRAIADRPAANQPTDKPQTKQQVEAAVDRRGYVR